MKTRLATRANTGRRHPDQVWFVVLIGEFRWFAYLIDCFRYTRNYEICVIEYERWFDDPTGNLTKLREFEPELKAAGITRLSLFGSVARGDSSSESDVDLMAEFDPARQFSLLDLVHLENSSPTF